MGKRLLGPRGGLGGAACARRARTPSLTTAHWPSVCPLTATPEGPGQERHPPATLKCRISTYRFTPGAETRGVLAAPQHSFNSARAPADRGVGQRLSEFSNQLRHKLPRPVWAPSGRGEVRALPHSGELVLRAGVQRGLGRVPALCLVPFFHLHLETKITQLPQTLNSRSVRHGGPRSLGWIPTLGGPFLEMPHGS